MIAMVSAFAPPGDDATRRITVRGPIRLIQTGLRIDLTGRPDPLRVPVMKC